MKNRKRLFTSEIPSDQFDPSKPLSKNQITKLSGGQSGVKLIIIFDCGFPDKVFVNCSVKAQRRSQKSPNKFPEGYLLLESGAFPEGLQYDIGRGQVLVLIRSSSWDDRIVLREERFDAKIYLQDERNPFLPELRTRSESWEARLNLLRETSHSRDDMHYVGSLMAEQRGLDWEAISSKGVADGCIQLASLLDLKSCLDLMDVIQTPPPPPRAEIELAVL